MKKIVLALAVVASGVVVWALLSGPPAEVPPSASAHEYPLEGNLRWTYRGPGNLKEQRTVLGTEEVEFKSRKVAATKLEVRRRRRDGSPIATDYEWYATGFGLVKLQVTLEVRAAFVLDSFGRMAVAR